MSKTHFTPRFPPTQTPGFWLRRELTRQSHRVAVADDEIAAQFQSRAQELRVELIDLLAAGLSDGVCVALSALAEEDMVDFCIMVDLAEPVALNGVEPLPEHTRQLLAQFLDDEPWHSLSVDHDITVTLALLDSVGVQPAQAHWYLYAPGLFDLLGRTCARASKEQFMRLVGEYQALAERDQIRLSDDAQELFNGLINQTAHRHGLGNQFT